MKLAVFDDYRIGIVENSDSTIRDVSEFLPSELDSWKEQRVNWVIRNWGSLAPIFGDPNSGRFVPLDHVVLRAANPAPSQVVALPSNFRAHLGEIGEMTVTPAGKTARDVGFFLIAPSSVSGAGEGLMIPGGTRRRFDHECEVAVIIGAGGRDITRETALDHVFGFSALVDATMRVSPGEATEDRSLRKSFQTFTPIGPWIVTSSEVTDFESIESHLSVNGVERQRAAMSDMIVGVAEAIEIASSVLELRPGDVIATGTPGGVGPVEDGDVLTITVDQIGSMRLPVTARSQRSSRVW